MEKEVEEYLSNITKLLNGQIRGAINKKAREENETLIRITVNDVFEKGQEYGETITTQKYQLEQLKKELKDK